MEGKEEKLKGILEYLEKNENMLNLVSDLVEYVGENKSRQTYFKEFLESPEALLGDYISDSDIEDYAESYLEMVNKDEVEIKDLDFDESEILEHLGFNRETLTLFNNQTLADQSQLKDIAEWFNKTNYIARQDKIELLTNKI